MAKVTIIARITLERTFELDDEDAHNVTGVRLELNTPQNRMAVAEHLVERAVMGLRPQFAVTGVEITEQL